LDYLRLSEHGPKLLRQFSLEGACFSKIFFVAALTPEARSMSEQGVSFGNTLDADMFSRYLLINAFGPIRFFEMLIEGQLLIPDFRAVFLTSKSGSTGLRGTESYMRPGGDMLYRASKSCLNNMIRNVAYDLQDRPGVVVALHPGYLPLDKIRKHSEQPDELNAIRALIERCWSLCTSHSGLFLDEHLNPLSW
jgi:NAD(P)-dependent dehydrogenase (short-subunit alcohol dehydrogenase family)